MVLFGYFWLSPQKGKVRLWSNVSSVVLTCCHAVFCSSALIILSKIGSVAFETQTAPGKWWVLLRGFDRYWLIDWLRPRWVILPYIGSAFERKLLLFMQYPTFCLNISIKAKRISTRKKQKLSYFNLILPFCGDSQKYPLTSALPPPSLSALYTATAARQGAGWQPAVWIRAVLEPQINADERRYCS